MNDKGPEGSGSAIINYRVLGVRISVADMDAWVRTVADAIKDRRRAILVSQNMHSAYINRQDPELTTLQQKADLVRIDGMPLVLVAKLLGLPVDRRHRAGFMDVLPHLMEAAAKNGWSIHYIGGQEGVADRAAEILRGRYPGLKLTVEHGYFDISPDSADVEAIAGRVEQIRPDILLVGMGMPRQEKFLLRHGDRFNATVLLTCGAALDYVAGEIPMAPRWLSAMGFEWLFRLLAEPRRLWQRYLVEPLHLVGPFFADLRNRGKGEEFFRYGATLKEPARQ